MKYEKIKQKIHEMYGHLPPFSRNNAAWGEIEREYLRCMVEIGVPIATLAMELKRSDCDVYHQAQVMNLRVRGAKPPLGSPSSLTALRSGGAHDLSLCWRSWNDLIVREDA